MGWRFQQRAKRGGCGRWLLYGVIGLAVLMGCGVLASVMAPSQRETPARVVPTWTNTPVPPTETPTATETATLAPTETPVPVPVVEERAGQGRHWTRRRDRQSVAQGIGREQAGER